MNSFWEKICETDLRQGDLLKDCLVPYFHPNYGKDDSLAEEVVVEEYDLIVLTQSCDLENNKNKLVAVCPISTVDHFSKANPEKYNKGVWEQVRRGRYEGLHLLSSPEDPGDNSLCLVVNFREVYSLPAAYLSSHAEQLGDRWRLRSPFLEHFSQAFARFFMRVGLPSAIPPFK